MKGLLTQEILDEAIRLVWNPVILTKYQKWLKNIDFQIELFRKNDRFEMYCNESIYEILKVKLTEQELEKVKSVKYKRRIELKIPRYER